MAHTLGSEVPNVRYTEYNTWSGQQSTRCQFYWIWPSFGAVSVLLNMAHIWGSELLNVRYTEHGTHSAIVSTEHGTHSAIFWHSSSSSSFSTTHSGQWLAECQFVDELHIQMTIQFLIWNNLMTKRIAHPHSGRRSAKCQLVNKSKQWQLVNECVWRWFHMQKCTVTWICHWLTNDTSSLQCRVFIRNNLMEKSIWPYIGSAKR